MSADELADHIRRFGQRYARHDPACALALAAEAMTRRGVSMAVDTACTCGMLAARAALVEAVKRSMPRW